MSGHEAVAGPESGVALRAVRGAFPIGAALGAAGLAGAAAVWVLGSLQLALVVCYFKAVTGLPRLTCGGTRAAMRLLGLDLAGALAMNPLVTLAGLAIAAWALADLVLLVRGRALRLEVSRPVARALRIAIPFLLAANWVYLIAVGR